MSSRIELQDDPAFARLRRHFNVSDEAMLLFESTDGGRSTDGLFKVKRLSSGDSSILRSLVAGGYVDHVIRGSLLLRIYAHAKITGRHSRPSMSIIVAATVEEIPPSVASLNATLQWLLSFGIVDYQDVQFGKIVVVDEYWKRRGTSKEADAWSKRFFERMSKMWPTILPHDVEALLEDANNLVLNDRPSAAVVTLRKARTLVDPLSVNSHPRAEAPAACERELASFLADADDEGRWMLHGTSRGTTVHIDRSRGNGGLIRFRCEAILESDLFACVSVINEVDDFRLWFPGIDQSSVLSTVSIFRRVVRISGAMPWPLSRDEMLIHAYGDTVDSRDILGPASRLGAGVGIYLKPASSEEWPRTPGCKRSDLVGGFWFEPQGRGKTRVIQVATVDPHILLPAFILNWVIVNVAYLILPMLYRQSRAYAPGGALHSKLRFNASVYDEIRRRLDTLAAGNGTSSQPPRSRLRSTFSVSKSPDEPPRNYFMRFFAPLFMLLCSFRRNVWWCGFWTGAAIGSLCAIRQANHQR